MKIRCRICNDDGRCKNNENSPIYDDSKSDLYDCCDYVNPNWINDWIRSLINENKSEYVSDFVKWSRSV